MLFQAYVFCLIVGGGLVVVSLLSGTGEADADLDADVEADMGADLEAGGDFGADVGAGDLDFGGDVGIDDLPFDFDLDGADIDADVDADAEAAGGEMEYEVSRQRRFNPLVSLKFWTFAAAFFGLTGVLFEGLSLWSSQIGVLALSLGVGVAMGTAMAYLIHIADQGAGEGLTEPDYLGASADVRLPIRADKTGKVRVRLRGRIIDMRADLAEGEQPLEMNDDCFVIEVDGNTATVIGAGTVEAQLTGDDSEVVLEDRADEQFDEELEEARKQQKHATS